MAMQRIFGSGFDVKELSPKPKPKSKKPGFGSAAGNWTVDAKLFLDMCEQLAKTLVPPVSVGDVFEAEVLSTLQLAAKKTKRATLTKVKGRYNPNSKHYNKYVKINGRLYPTKVKAKRVNGKFAKGYSAGFQARINRRMKFYATRALDRLGLSKSIYYKIAKDDLKLKGYDRNWHESSMIKRSYEAQQGKKGDASRSKGKGVDVPPPSKSWSKSAAGWKMKHNEALVIKFTADTFNTLNPYTKGMGAFQKALNGRAGQFKLGMRRGFFDQSKWVSERYPNVKTT